MRPHTRAVRHEKLFGGGRLSGGIERFKVAKRVLIALKATQARRRFQRLSVGDTEERLQ